MGDTNRNLEFCRFIKKRFQKAKSALIIADGKAELARKLANVGINSLVIEANPRFSGNYHPLIQYRKGFFTSETNVDFNFDIIVGMHPDEATGEIIEFGEKHKIPWAVVPCCAVGKYSDGLATRGYVQWINRLKNKSNCYSANLKISGRNLVLFKN